MSIFCIWNRILVRFMFYDFQIFVWCWCNKVYLTLILWSSDVSSVGYMSIFLVFMTASLTMHTMRHPHVSVGGLWRRLISRDYEHRCTGLVWMLWRSLTCAGCPMVTTEELGGLSSSRASEASLDGMLLWSHIDQIRSHDSSGTFRPFLHHLWVPPSHMMISTTDGCITRTI